MVGTTGSATPPALRIVFFGTPEFAAPTLRALLASRHPVVGVVTQPDRARGRGQKVSFSPVKALALTQGLPIIQPDTLRDPAVRDTLHAWRADLGVVAAYGRIIPEAMLAIPRLGMINVHGSLLPRLRGAAPVHRAVIDGDTQTGITIMRLVKNLDAGDMFARVTRPIGPDETSDVVESELAAMGATLLVTVVDQIAAGTAVEEPQDYMFATYAPKITREDGLVDWSLPAPFIHNRVRGLYPWPHAYSFLEGYRLILLRTHVVPGPSDAPPGTVVEVTRDTLQVATGHQGRIAIDALQMDGRRPVTTREFLAGHPVPIGSRFTGSPERGAVPLADG